MITNVFDNNGSDFFSLRPAIAPVFPELVIAPSIDATSEKDSLYSLNASFVLLHSHKVFCNTAPVPFLQREELQPPWPPATSTTVASSITHLQWRART